MAKKKEEPQRWTAKRRTALVVSIIKRELSAGGSTQARPHRRRGRGWKERDKLEDLMSTWPFTDPPNVAVFTSKEIAAGQAWIYYVSHDADDGAWQFHAQNGPTSESNAAIVGLKTIVDIDPTVLQLADLPKGWHAWREHPTATWQRARTDS